MSPKLRLILEALALYVALPLIVLAFRSRILMVGIFWIASVVVAAVLHWCYGVSPEAEWNVATLKREWKRPLILFLCLAPIITLGTWYLYPASFLSLPLHRTQLWLLILVLYPPLSVVPQEIVYRSWFFRRYGALFKTKEGGRFASATAFAVMHMVLLNPVAVFMTGVGGYIFARRYQRSHSLALVWFEHTLYGLLVFTLGLGRFFYTGAAWR